MNLSNNILAIIALAFLITPLQADWSSLDTDERLSRLEKILKTQTATIERLRNELQELRGKVEIQNHKLDSFADKRSTSTSVETSDVSTEETGETPLVPANAAPFKNNEATDVTSEETSNINESELDAYNQSFEQLKAGQYEAAIKGFQAQLSTYPQGQYAGNAQYWLGETYYVTRDFDSAIQAFTQVVEQYPKSNKVAGATLKLGFIYHERGQAEQAIELLQKVIANFPNSNEAKFAQQRLDLIVR